MKLFKVNVNFVCKTSQVLHICFLVESRGFKEKKDYAVSFLTNNC